ncbi:MAG TPA: TetR/AcrR family transcriptional regulator C-terminal domain-containing protein [Bryobacteraceae bacterium]|nr:TetR/AcrR family transcriptional regulator C-terminal domain-containing protein [Bryobacteraceae bacterium]
MQTLSSERERSVLDGALQLFEKYPLREITLEKLTKTSGVPAFDIIRNFHSSENILRAVLERELELMAAAATAPELRMPGETIADELRLLARVIFNQYHKRMPFLRKLLGEALNDSSVAALYYSTFIVQGRELFAQFLRTRAESGEFRPNLDIEAASATFLASLLGSVMTFELFGGRQVESLDEDRLLREICETFAHGILKK